MRRGTVCTVDNDYGDTQWTDAAKSAYKLRAQELIEALQAHLTANLMRSGRQKELQPYFESADRVMASAQAFNEAEFDWCGSFPLDLGPDAEDDEDEDLDERAGGQVLSVVGRWDFRITDEDAVLAAGRAAYLRAWPDDTQEDAEIRVQQVDGAAAELEHADGLTALDNAAGLELHRDVIGFIVHDGGDDETFDNDPFGITRD